MDGGFFLETLCPFISDSQDLFLCFVQNISVFFSRWTLFIKINFKCKYKMLTSHNSNGIVLANYQNLKLSIHKNG